MADVNINIFTNKVYKQGASTVVPGFIEGEEPTPINPSGSGGASEFVPYVGATENFDLGEFGLSAGFLKLDTTPTSTPTDQGTMYWDEDDNTVDIILNGYIMKVGEDLFYPVKNQTGSSIAKGTNVGFAGTLGSSGRLLITPYLADGTNPTSRYMGVTAETIANGDDGKVLWFGRVRGINTNAFNEGDILYASTSSAGAFQTTLPVAPNNIVEVAAVVNKSSTQGVIFVRPQFLSSGGSIGAGAGLSIDDNGDIQLGNGGVGVVDISDTDVFTNGFYVNILKTIVVEEDIIEEIEGYTEEILNFYKLNEIDKIIIGGHRIFNEDLISESQFFSDGSNGEAFMSGYYKRTQGEVTYENRGFFTTRYDNTGNRYNLSIGMTDGLVGFSLVLVKNYNNDSFKANIIDNINSKGLEYDSDYESNFTARSLVTKQYVDGISQTVATTGTVNNLSITSSAKLLILTNATDLTGIIAPTSTRIIIIEARGASRIIRDQSASSTAGNRFALGADLTINDGEVYQFIYTNSRWRRVL
jgi:hypothetical protein